MVEGSGFGEQLVFVAFEMGQPRRKEVHDFESRRSSPGMDYALKTERSWSGNLRHPGRSWRLRSISRVPTNMSS